MERQRRIYGPYKHGGRWRLLVGFPGGRQAALSFATRAEAEAAAREARARLEATGPRLLDDALTAYEKHLTDKGNKPKSIGETIRRVERFLGGRGGTVAAVTPTRCGEAYQALTGAMAVDSHRNLLAEAKSFGRWLARQRWVRANPLEHVTGIGRRRHGKTQLRIDEARAWLRRAHERAQEGEAGAVAALLTLLLGLRCSEVVGLRGRDVDDGGALIWVEEAKTEAGRRRVLVPEELRGYLKAEARGKLPLASLFGEHWRDWPRKWVQRICDEAGVPRVCAHAMRGLHATLAFAAGAAGELVAATLGHTSAAVTRESYATREAVATGAAIAAGKALKGE